MHGDYRYDHLKNTPSELQQQEALLRDALIKECANSPLVACGYSGRDESLMEALRAAYGRPGSGTLYWCAHDIDDVPESVLRLLGHARANGRQAFLVGIQGFDDLMVRLCLHCLDGSQRTAAADVTSRVGDRQNLHLQPFEAKDLPTTSVLKSNAFELECPSEILTFDIGPWPAERVWKWVKEQTKSHPVAAVPFKGKVLAIGTVDGVKACFGSFVKGEILRAPVAEQELRYEDGAIVSLMREALVRSVASSIGVATDDKGELWLLARKAEREAGTTYETHESVLVFIRRFQGHQYLVLKPSVKILTVDGALVPSEVANAIRLRILGWQHNREFNDAVEMWRRKLFANLAAGETQATYEFPPACGSTFRFLLRRTPLFAQVGANSPTARTKIADRFKPLMKQRGLELIEPKLLFGSRTGGVARDSHPVRGILANRPFDHALTERGFVTSLRLGVICPKPETGMLRTYLQRSKETIPPGQYEKDYLPSFPGFETAFGVRLEIPEPGTAAWVTLGEADPSLDQKAQTIETGKNINRAVEALLASSSPSVILILFPQRWSALQRFETDDERFDVHDFVKSYCVQRGVGTQFLGQDTLSDALQCRVWWWLSLAFYTKSMRTPWLLEGLDDETAFVGLGFSLKPAGQAGRHVVLGCSHIYSARGEGLQYRLSKVENPVFVRGDPFLSRDDARRVGERIRELFFASRLKLPERVVIHKRTRFTRDESAGLREGLGGVANVDMLEIIVDPALRYVASSVDRSGNLRADGYPVKRGTAVLLDDYSALVWVHGASLEVDPAGHRPYFQGKRRIPAPLVVRRHSGSSDLSTVAREVLGLSKMNWNTFDLYTKLPATVHSSNEIARIGSLLERFGASSYDFRLFI
jgi:hypothetical protein